jgi:peptidoglycan/LPS O-acetylase OafA/YrhL
LITSILLKQRHQAPALTYLLFLCFRLLRILPIYYATIFFLFEAPHIKEELIYLHTYSFNYRLAITGNLQTIFVHFWSLCVEEQFYLLFPVVTLFFRLSNKGLFIVYGLLAILALTQLSCDMFIDQKYNYTGLLSNMWPLCLGAIGALLGGKFIKTGFLNARFF